MAKKRIEQPADHEQESIEYSDVEPEVVEDDAISDLRGKALDTEYAELMKGDSDYLPDPTLSKSDEQDDVYQIPGGPSVSLNPKSDDPFYRVTLALPYGVLVALLDLTHDDADWDEATFKYHLLEDGNLTPIGELVLAGFDQTAVRHKMNAAWRENHNRGVGGVK